MGQNVRRLTVVSRVFAWDDHVMLLFTAPPRGPLFTQRGVKRMHVQVVYPYIGQPVMLLADGVAEQRKEKNWCAITPIGHTSSHRHSDYLFARSVDPHEILRCSWRGTCHMETSSHQPAFFGSLMAQHGAHDLHLGTNAVRVSRQHYGAILHAVIGHGPGEHKGPRRYVNIPYLFEALPPYRIVAVRQAPLELVSLPSKKGHDFVFTSALVYLDGLLVVSYNFNDETSSFSVHTAEDVFGNMTHLPTYSVS